MWRTQLRKATRGGGPEGAEVGRVNGWERELGGSTGLQGRPRQGGRHHSELQGREQPGGPPGHSGFGSECPGKPGEARLGCGAPRAAVGATVSRDSP